MFSKIFVLLLALSSIQCLSLSKSENSPFYNGEIIFIGASITEFWETHGINVWNKWYKPLGAIDVGVAGDATANTIAHINDGFINNFNPRIIVLNIGNNDLGQGKPENYVVDQIGKILNLLKGKFPQVKIILLQILPRTPASIHQQARNVNAQIVKYDDGQSVFYLDMEDEFCTGLGQIRQELYQNDGLHLVEKGYTTWAETMKPIFDRLYNNGK